MKHLASCKVASRTQVITRCQSKHQASKAVNHNLLTRRQSLCGAIILPMAVFSPMHEAEAKERNQEADDATSPYIQELLRRSSEKRDERAKAMLKSYMKKNYKDYFDYETAGARGLSEESKQNIKKWLKENS